MDLGFSIGRRSSPSLGMDGVGRIGPGLVDAGKDYLGHPNDPPIAAGGSDTDADEQLIIKSTIETYNHEYEIRKPQEVIWDRCWRRVQNRYDFSRKSRWQSQKSLPAVTIMAYKIAWEIVKSLEKAGDKWFEAQTAQPEWQPLLDVPRDLVNEFLRSTGDDPANSFLTVYFRAIFFGIITGQVYIRTVAEVDGFVDMTSDQDNASLENISQAAVGELQTSLPSYGFGSVSGQPASPEEDSSPALPGKKGFRLQFEALNARYLFKDTNYRRSPRYVLHFQTMTKGEYREEGTARGWRYIEEVCTSQIGSGSPSMYSEKNRDTIEKDLAKDPKRLDNVYLIHYYGTLYDGLGNIVEYNGVPIKNSYFVMANNKYVVWGPEPLPYWHGQIPIVIGQTLPLPGAPYSKSILELNVEGQETRVELVNMLLDYLNQAINPPTEIDMDQINSARPNQLNTGIYPGKIFEVQKMGNQGPAVTRSAMNDVGTGVWQSLGWVKNELNEFSGMDGMTAMPRTRNRISVQEGKAREAASGGIIELAVKNLERDVLEPFLWQTYLVGLQKYPQKMWEEFIDSKIEAVKNRTQQIPPGAAPAPPPTPPQPNPVGRPPSNLPGPQPPQPPPGAPSATPQPAVPGGPPPPPTEDPAYVAKLQDMRSWGPKERFTKLGALFRFSVKIYTALESRRDNLEKFSQLTQMAEATPGLMQRIKWHEVGEEIMRSLELDPERFLWPNAGATAEAMGPLGQSGIMPSRPTNLFPPPPPNAPPPNSY